MKSVLVVEDDDTLREVYATKLDIEGFRVDTAADGAEGLSKALDQPPDIVLLDMIMPRLTGLQFLEHFGLDRHPRVKALVISNHSAPAAIERAKALGAADYLIKSNYTPAQIVEHIRLHTQS
jgi:CheY-like chemotaxis protein